MRDGVPQLGDRKHPAKTEVLISPVVCDSIDCRTFRIDFKFERTPGSYHSLDCTSDAVNCFATEEGSVLLAIHLERRKGCSVQCGGMKAGWH